MQSPDYSNDFTAVTHRHPTVQIDILTALAELNCSIVYCTLPELISGPIPMHRRLLLDYGDCCQAQHNLLPRQIKTTPCDIVIYNAPQRLSTAVLLSLGRLRGIFYAHDAHQVLVRGLHNILNGHLAIPEAICHQLLNHYQQQYPTPSNTGTRLSQRESQVLRELLSGQSNLKIADRFCISEVTVKSHLHNIYRKLEVKNRRQAIEWAKRHFIYNVTP
ncbi:MAG: LuxR C-terminal-related transcriptional regulator [Vibrio sp.]